MTAKCDWAGCSYTHVAGSRFCAMHRSRHKAQMQAMRTAHAMRDAVARGTLTINQARKMKDLPPLGDESLYAGGIISMDEARERKIFTPSRKPSFKRMWGIRHLRYVWAFLSFRLWWDVTGTFYGPCPREADSQYLDDIWYGRI